MMHCASRGIATVSRPSVRASVRLSVWPYTPCLGKKSLWFTMHNCNKCEYIFTVFGTNHRDRSFF